MGAPCVGFCHITASEIRDFKRCPFLYYAGKKNETALENTAALSIGNNLHAELETATTEETIFSEEARAAWREVPGTPVMYEREWKFDHVNIGIGVPVVGKIDLLSVYGVGDYKFTSNIDLQLKDVSSDEQLLLYALASKTKLGVYPERVFQIQVDYNTLEARYVEAEVTSQYLENGREILKNLASSMRRTTDSWWLDVPIVNKPHSSACTKYGRPCKASRFCDRADGMVGGVDCRTRISGFVANPTHSKITNFWRRL